MGRSRRPCAGERDRDRRLRHARRRFGRRNVIIGTLVLSVPAILLYTAFPGRWAFGSAILIGFFAASTPPLMLLMAQQLMVARAGLASGLVMGLGFVTGAIGIPINGAIADAIGLQKSLMTHVILVIHAGGLPMVAMTRMTCVISDFCSPIASAMAPLIGIPIAPVTNPSPITRPDARPARATMSCCAMRSMSGGVEAAKKPMRIALPNAHRPERRVKEDRGDAEHERADDHVAPANRSASVPQPTVPIALASTRVVASGP